MITDLDTYWKEVMEKGTLEAKILLQTESLFALTEAQAIMNIFLDPAEPLSVEDAKKVAKIQERLTCLLICHRGPVLAQWLMERSRGVPVPVDGPGPVIPGQLD